jgi:aspartate-semialdehyde dehydrogenase
LKSCRCLCAFRAPLNGKEITLKNKYKISATACLMRPFFPPEPDPWNWHPTCSSRYYGNRQFGVHGSMDPTKKLVVLEGNGALGIVKEDKIIANPNCSTIQMGGVAL